MAQTNLDRKPSLRLSALDNTQAKLRRHAQFSTLIKGLISRGIFHSRTSKGLALKGEEWGELGCAAFVPRARKGPGPRRAKRFGSWPILRYAAPAGVRERVSLLLFAGASLLAKLFRARRARSLAGQAPAPLDSPAISDTGLYTTYEKTGPRGATSENAATQPWAGAVGSANPVPWLNACRFRQSAESMLPRTVRRASIAPEDIERPCARYLDLRTD